LGIGNYENIITVNKKNNIQRRARLTITKHPAAKENCPIISTKIHTNTWISKVQCSVLSSEFPGILDRIRTRRIAIIKYNCSISICQRYIRELGFYFRYRREAAYTIYNVLHGLHDKGVRYKRTRYIINVTVFFCYRYSGVRVLT